MASWFEVSWTCSCPFESVQADTDDELQSLIRVWHPIPNGGILHLPIQQRYCILRIWRWVRAVQSRAGEIAPLGTVQEGQSTWEWRFVQRSSQISHGRWGPLHYDCTSRAWPALLSARYYLSQGGLINATL